MDIVERLRRTELHHVWDDLEGKMVGKMFSANPDGPEAADEIERLRGIINDDRLEKAADEIERLREENQRRKEHTILLYSLVQTEHEMIRIAALKESE